MERTRAASKQPAWNGWLIGGAIALLPWHVAAQEAPEAIIQRLSQEVLGRAKADLAGPDADLRRAMALVDSAIMPHVNMQRLTPAAVGPAWRQATPQQRVRFQQEFKSLLVRTYAGALSQVTQETIKLRPQRTAPDENDVVVRTEVRGRGEPIELAYRMERTSGQDGRWRIYNLNVLGIWLAETYRGQSSRHGSSRAAWRGSSKPWPNAIGRTPAATEGLR